jgi:hypothetical protein
MTSGEQERRESWEDYRREVDKGLKGTYYVQDTLVTVIRGRRWCMGSMGTQYRKTSSLLSSRIVPGHNCGATDTPHSGQILFGRKV